ncbi:MAG: hypothetical protein GY811_09845, partial [Myxococcales bacterium]|nr:hypothetical protein [Myxococcales bacterium]
MKHTLFSTLLLALLACGGSHRASPASPSAGKKAGSQPTASANLKQVPRYQELDVGTLDEALVNPEATPLAITHVTIMTAAGETIEDGSIVMQG